LQLVVDRVHHCGAKRHFDERVLGCEFTGTGPPVRGAPSRNAGGPERDARRTGRFEPVLAEKGYFMTTFRQTLRQGERGKYVAAAVVRHEQDSHVLWSAWHTMSCDERADNPDC